MCPPSCTISSKVYSYLVDEYQNKAEDQIEKYLKYIWQIARNNLNEFNDVN